MTGYDYTGCDYADCGDHGIKIVRCLGFEHRLCSKHHTIVTRLMFKAEIELLKFRQEWIFKMLGFEEGGDA
jgi:hypothetical protein